MFETKNLNTLPDNYYDDYMDELNVFDQEFNTELSNEQIEFGDDLFNFFQDIMEEETSDDINEEFTSEPNLNYHYNTHCIAYGKKHASKRN